MTEGNPGRSYLSVPGSDLRKMTKALASAADNVVLDLEDAVAPGNKDEARRAVVAALAESGSTRQRRIVRINAAGTPWCHHDVQALAEAVAPPDAIMLPKVESAGDVAFLDRLLAGVEAASRNRIAVHALIESAAGVAHLDEIAGSSNRLTALLLGYADLAASLGRRTSGSHRPELWLSAQDATVVAARTHGLAAVDGPHLGVADDEPFRAAVDHATAIGFDGKWVLHPAQVETVNRAFTPTSEEIAHAREVLSLLETATAAGTGAVAHKGHMLDEAVAVAARRTLTRAPQSTEHR